MGFARIVEQSIIFEIAFDFGCINMRCQDGNRRAEQVTISQVLKLRCDFETASLGGLPRGGVVIADLREVG